MLRYIFIFTFLLCSCARFPMLPYRLEGEKEDVLSEESFRRWDRGRIVNLSENFGPVVLCHQGDFKKAFEEFSSKFAQFKENPWYWNQLGTCYLLSNKFILAKLYFNEGLGRLKRGNKNNKAIFYNNIGVVYYRTENWDKALHFYRKSLALNISSKTIHFNLANIYLRFALPEAARKEFLYLYKYNQEDADVLNGLGLSFLLQNNLKSAEEYFKQIAEKYFEREDLAINYALLLYLTGNYDKSVDILEMIEVADNNYQHPSYLKLKNMLELKRRKTKKK